MAHLRERRHDTRIAFAHKPFVLLCKGIDWIVEPNMRRQDVDLCERGGNLALCNAMHYITPGIAGRDYYARLLSDLQNYMRNQAIWNQLPQHLRGDILVYDHLGNWIHAFP
jgi:hypothetical protein